MRVEDIPCLRELPNAFLRAEGTAQERVLRLVDRCWADYSERQRRELTQALLALLQPLLDDGRAADNRIRERCEAAVSQWLVRARAPGRRRRRGEPSR